MSDGAPARLLIVGNPDPVHVGAHLLAAAAECGIAAEILDVRRAYEGPAWRQKADWWMRGHRPANLAGFSRIVLDTVRTLRPTTLLTTGIAPVDRRALEALRRLRVQRVNFLTDDPWNPAHAAPWFLSALPQYDAVFSPRRANMAQLRALGVPLVEYVPFAYSPAVHFPAAATEAEPAADRPDVLFAGGGDADRARIIGALASAGLRVALFGGYWDRFAETRGLAGPTLDAAALRAATSAAAVALVLVRRANRDGHSMRTFEVPAMAGCPLFEATADHRELFGSEEQNACYFDDEGDVVPQVRRLLADDDLRARLAARAHARVTGGGHTYGDRLQAMLTILSRESRESRARRTRTFSRV